MRMPGRDSGPIPPRSGWRDFREVAFRVLPWGSAAWPCVISFALVDWDLREPYLPILEQTLCQRKSTHNMLVLLDYLLHQQCGRKGNRQNPPTDVNILTVLRRERPALRGQASPARTASGGNRRTRPERCPERFPPLRRYRSRGSSGGGGGSRGGARGARRRPSPDRKSVVE